MERRREGALLVVGRRGSGKSSSVIDAANRAARAQRRAGRGGGGAIIPTMIKATVLDGGEDRHGGALLKGLIWALCTGLERADGVDGRLRGRARDLYLSATAAERSVDVSRS